MGLGHNGEDTDLVIYWEGFDLVGIQKVDIGLADSQKVDID